MDADGVTSDPGNASMSAFARRERAEQRALSDSGRADDDQTSRTVDGLSPEILEQRQLRRAADEGIGGLGETRRRGPSAKAAHADRMRNAFQHPVPDRLHGEVSAQQSHSCGTEQHLVGPGDLLEASCDHHRYALRGVVDAWLTADPTDDRAS